MNLPSHRLGVHLIGNNESNLQYIERLKPPAVKIVDPDPAVVRRVLKALDPNGVCILRDHPLSEQKDDMAKDPVGTGVRHAEDWFTKLATGRFREFGNDSRIVVCGINEPNVHNPAEEQIVFEYTRAFLNTLTARRIRGLALNLSVGWPRNEGAGKPPIWDTFLPLEPLIDLGNHFLGVHEYWYPTVESGWGWYGNRIAACPMAVPIIVGECGYTRQLVRMDIQQPWGWQGNLTADEYVRQLLYYHDRVHPNVFAVLPFTTGFGGAEWASKDTQPLHDKLVSGVRPYSWPKPWPQLEQPLPPTTPPPVDPEVGFRLLWPKMDRITQWFGGKHSGLDIAKVVGTPVYAAWEGKVAWTDFDPNGYGKYVRVYHPELGFDLFYAHLSEQKVVRDQRVKRGDLLGLTGNTGNSTGPHLHLEVRLKQDNSTLDRPGVGPFSRGQVDPIAVKWALANLYGFDER